MPAKSAKQRRLMQAVKHNPDVARRKGITPAQARKVLGHGEGEGEGKASHAKPQRRTYKGAKTPRILRRNRQ